MATGKENNGEITVAVLGNPNTGKSTLFNALTGFHQRTGNYPGVTVERRIGWFQHAGQKFRLVDLPGSYSLAPRSPDEMLTVNVLLGRAPAEERPDIVLCVIDASNLERNLFIVSQALDLGRPIVVAANMTDLAEKTGLQIDWSSLSESLGVAVVPVQANKNLGLDRLKKTLLDVRAINGFQKHTPFVADVGEALDKLEMHCPTEMGSPRFVATRMMFDSDGFMARQFSKQNGSDLTRLTEEARQSLVKRGYLLTELESKSRYDWIRDRLRNAVSRSPVALDSVTRRLDRVLTHPVWGLLVAAFVLAVMFQMVFWIAEPASIWIDALVGFLTSVVERLVPSGACHSLLVDGLINGVGSVLVFLPQIFLLFMFLGILEDSGYLSRAAFLGDRFLSAIGLSGVSIFPLLSSFACAVPGIMATRLIKDSRERLITILIAPLMSCSARLPVYVLLISAFIPDMQVAGGLLGLRGLTMLAMYLVGVVSAIAVAYLLRKTWLKFGGSSFVLELPAYQRPSCRNVLRRMIDGGWTFVRDAGPIIVAATILVWAAAYFPRADQKSLPQHLAGYRELIEQFERQGSVEPDQRQAVLIAEAENRLNAYQLEQSFLGRAGRLIEPVVRPLGWDWRIASAVLASFPAREVVVSTMGVIFGLGDDANEESESLRESLRAARRGDNGEPLFTIPVALSLMVLFALCAQCVSTLAVIRRETNSYGWPVFTFVYMTLLAYFAAWATFQVSRLFV